MLDRLTVGLRTLYHPARYHGRGRRRFFFEGWYYKLVDRAAARPLAVIPGVVHGPDAHAFVQLLDGAAQQAYYYRYPFEAFEAADDAFDVRVAGSRFGLDALTLDLAGDGPAVRGALRFEGARPWPVRAWSPGAMGPFAFVPGMECRHGVVSLDHRLSGTLALGGADVAYDGGRGYTEKDWGRGFPEAYVWLQANHFDAAAAPGDGPCVTLSLARIPWHGLRFDGFIGGVLVGGRLYRFCTYTGARLRRLDVRPEGVEAVLTGSGHTLEVEARRTEVGVPLRAPVPEGMTDRVAQTMRAHVHARLLDAGGAAVWEGESGAASLETQRAGRLRPR